MLYKRLLLARNDLGKERVELLWKFKFAEINHPPLKRKTASERGKGHRKKV